ncbi:MAG TPA: nucleotide disphospho-sugar-binding domain-containing protein [Blastocatellia bacterium]|nr:nucleotide disphospho-sugar-binding domain-containing protein [Blastocatellia bacterium]
MATITFFPHPEFGHLNPPLKLARSLKQRGHRVYYIGLPDFEDYVRSQGVEYRPIFEKRCPRGYLKRRASEKAERDLDNLSLLLWEAAESKDAAFDLFKEMEKEFAGLLADGAPDLMIIDFKLRDLAALTVKKFGLPTAILSVTLIDLAPLGAVETSKAAHSGLPELFLCPKAFDFPSATKPHRHYIEASIELGRREAYDFPWEKLDDSRPLIYCSFGSQPYQYEQSEALFGAIIEAVGERPEWQLVLAVGTHLKATHFNPLPDNVLVVNWAPQLKLLERAAVMITHGGMGAVKECIFFAVPMIVFPCRWDQPHNAARVVHHGLGLRGDISDGSVGQVRRLLEELSGGGQYKARVAAMSRTFREVEDSGIGVRTVENILSDYQHRRPALSAR